MFRVLGSRSESVAAQAVSESNLKASCANRLPEIDYPSPWVVRNTFIDGVERQFSLEGIFEERRIHSCPSSALDVACGVPEVPELWTCSKLAERLGRLPEADGSARSRSTSAGSSPKPSSDEGAFSLDLPAIAGPAKLSCVEASVLPEFDHPSAFFVKNTFIHAAIGRPLSLDEFYEERRLRSCPVSMIVADPSSEESVANHAIRAGKSTAALPEAQAPASKDAFETLHRMGAEGSPGIPPPPVGLPILDVPPQFAAVPPPPWEPAAFLWPSAAPVPEATLLLLSAAIQEPTCSSLKLATPGSEKHFSDTCNPCAHFHSAKGCKNGVECPFCHRCPPGELKRRQKAKRSANRRDH